MRVVAAVTALIGMSGCTLFVVGEAISGAHHSSSRGNDPAIGSALLDAMLLDLTAIALLGLIETHPPTTSPPPWDGGVRTHPPLGSGGQ